MARKIIKVEPWGGIGGDKWVEGNFNGVREITLKWDTYIDSITVVYDKNGVPIAGDRHGGSGGTNTCKIVLRYPEEYLTGISGKYCQMSGGNNLAIYSLRFESNQRSFGHFGKDWSGTPFSFLMDGGSIVGFQGRSGWYLDSIGIFCAPL